MGRDNLPRLKYGRKSLWGLAVGGPTVDGALVTRGGARARIKNDLLPHKCELQPFRRRLPVRSVLQLSQGASFDVLLPTQVGQCRTLHGRPARNMPVWKLSDAVPLVGRPVLPARRNKLGVWSCLQALRFSSCNLCNSRRLASTGGNKRLILRK